MSLCATGMLEALSHIEEDDCKMVSHKEEHSFEEVMKMFVDEKPKHHMLRMSDGSMVDSATLM